MYHESPSRCLGGERVDKRDSNSHAKEHDGSSPLQGIILRNENSHWMSNSIRGLLFYIGSERWPQWYRKGSNFQISAWNSMLIRSTINNKVLCSISQAGSLRYKLLGGLAMVYWYLSWKAGQRNVIMRWLSVENLGHNMISPWNSRMDIWFLLISQSMNLSTLC